MDKDNDSKKVEYVQVYTPDKMRLAEVVTGCKGPDRTMAQFAEDCEVSASTLSRIVNCKITKPVSEELLRMIYEKRCEGYKDMPFEALMQANGMRNKEDQERMIARGRAFLFRQERLERERALKNTIITNLVSRGVAIQRVTQRMIDCPDNSPQYLSRRSSMTLYLPETETFHNFFFFTQVREKEEDSEYRRPFSFDMQRIMERCSGLFLIDAWQPDCLENEVTSFVFIDRGYYEEFCKTLKISRLNSVMNALLIDLKEGTILEDQRLGQYDGEYSSIFDRAPIPETGDDFWEEDFHQKNEEDDE